MDYYNNFLKWYRATIATCIAVFSVYLSNTLKSKVDNVYILILGLIFAVITFRSFEVLAEKAIDKFLLLRKLIWGHQFIEGHWLDVVYKNNSRDVSFGGLILIQFNKGQFYISGCAYDLEGHEFGTFSSSSSSYSNFLLQYSHIGLTSDKPGGRVMGYGEYQFDRIGCIPFSYQGIYFDSEDKTLLNSKAERIVDKKQLSVISIPDKRKELVMNHINNKIESDKAFRKNSTIQQGRSPASGLKY